MTAKMKLLTIFMVALTTGCFIQQSIADEIAVRIAGFRPGMVTQTEYIAPTFSRHGFDFHSVDGDIYLHINPRYNQRPRALVVSTHLNGWWRGQRRPPNFPFFPGENTTITVFANSSAFDIYANGGIFHYRYPYYDGTDNNRIDRIIHWGHNIKGITVGKVLPNFGFGKVVYIHGRAPRRGKFNLDFLPTTPDNYSTEDIHLRLSVRFDLTPPVVIRNTLTSSRCDSVGWGTEERDGVMPFVPGEDFIVTVFTQQYGFEVAVNGSHFTTYRYREPLAADMMIMLFNVAFLQKIEYY